MDISGFGYTSKETHFEKIKLGLKKEVNIEVYVSNVYSSDGTFGDEIEPVRTRILFFGIPIPFTSKSHDPSSSEAQKILREYRPDSVNV